MSEIKSKAIGFLYTLATDNQTRQSWAADPDWDKFFDKTLDEDVKIINDLNDIGEQASGRAIDPENKLKWKQVVDSMQEQILNGLLDKSPNLENFSVEVENFNQQLGVLLAELVYNQDIREQFLSEPDKFVNNLPDNETYSTALTTQFKQNLIEFGHIINKGQLDEAKTYLTEILSIGMCAQYINEQSLIW